MLAILDKYVLLIQSRVADFQINTKSMHDKF